MALGAPFALASGCSQFAFDEGLFNPCVAPHRHAAFRNPWVEKAWEGIRADRVWDMHAHLFGNGRSGSGIYVDPDLDVPRSIGGRVRSMFFRNAGCVGEDQERFDQSMVARLVHLADELPAGAKVMLLAFDFTHDEAGKKRTDLTTFAVPDVYAQRVAAERPDRFEWIASVHPYRADAIEALERARKGGARAVKWLPPAMGIEVGSRRCVPFYEALARLDLPLLVHVGEEQAVAGAKRHDLANPLFLRVPLERGVRVIAAHCATLGESPDIEAVKDPAKAPQVANFDLFSRLMAERRYEGRLFGDISAVTQANRASYLPAILAKSAWEGRLLNGSDYPLPAVMPLFSPKSIASLGLLDERAIPAIRGLRQVNALMFDFVLKRSLRHHGRTLPASAFETRGFFDKLA